MSRLLLLAVLLAACVPPDPPIRAMVEIPAAPGRDLPFQTERQAVESVREVLLGSQMGWAGAVRVVLSPRVVLPLAGKDAILVGRFLVPGAAARDVLASAGQALTGNPLDLSDWSDADVASANLAFQISRITEAFGHGMAEEARSHDLDTAWVDDRRALDLCWPMLNTMVGQSQLPADVRSSYPRLLQALLDSFPAEVTAHLPTHPATTAALYNASAAHRTEGAPPSDTDAQIAAALALRYALEATRATEAPLASFVQSFDADPNATLNMVVAGLADPSLVAQKVQWKVNESHVIGWYDGTALEFGLDVTEPEHRVEAWMWQALPVPPAREADVLRLVNLANLEHGGTQMELQKDRIVLAMVPRDPFSLGMSAFVLGQLRAQADRWFGPIGQVARGEISLDAAKKAVLPPAPKEGN